MPLSLYVRGGVFWVRGRPADGDRYVRQSTGTAEQALAEAEVRKIEGEARKRRILGPDAPKPEDELTFSAASLLYTPAARDARYLMRLMRRIGKLRVREITPAFQRQLAREMMPHASVDTWQREIITPICAVINNASDAGKCAPVRFRRFDKDAWLRQDRARGKESRVPRTPGSWPWLRAFMGNAEPRDAALAYFMFRHGSRISQSIAMTRSRDMDLSAGRVRLPPTKGHEAAWITLDPEEVAMIANLPVPYRGQARDRVFTIAGGRSGALYRRWKATCEAAGIVYLPPHSAGRHGFGTEMIVRQGIDPVSAADAGRWSSPAVLLKTYAHAENSEAKVRAAFMVGKEATRTPAVQAEAEGNSNMLAKKRKSDVA